MTVGPSDYDDDMPATDVQIDSIREDIRALSDTVSVVLVRLDNMDARFDGMDQRFDKLEGRFDKLEGRFDKLEGRFDNLEGSVREILTLVRRGS
jgi:predicted nuclease with TOPRIM domain